MERREQTITLIPCSEQLTRLLDRMAYCDEVKERVDARLEIVKQHAALVEQRDLLAQALRDVRAKFFEHAQSGANVVKGELVPLDNEQHPWIPGVEAPRAIEIINNALATVEQGGES